MIQASPEQALDFLKHDGTDSPSARSLTVLGSTLVMKGELYVGGDLVIRGSIQGTVVGTDTVTIKKDARLRGRISATTIRIEYGVRLDEVTLSGKIAQIAESNPD